VEHRLYFRRNVHWSATVSGHLRKESDSKDFPRTLGTPTKLIYPGLEDLPLYKPDWPMYKPEHTVLERVKRMDKQGQELLMSMLRYDPQKRVDCNNALRHAYFNCLPGCIRDMGSKDSKK
jgi:serine/threonine protein kinase